MLVFDFSLIGNRLLNIRKKSGLTQSEVAELAELSDRTYADIERGSVNMRIETTLKICQALHITPDTILTTDDAPINSKREYLLGLLDSCSAQEQETALQLLSVYLSSLKREPL